MHTSITPLSFLLGLLMMIPRSMGKLDASLTLSSEHTAQVIYRIINNDNKVAHYLPWSTPLDGIQGAQVNDAFDIFGHDGRFVRFRGVRVKRLVPSDEDMVAVEPGQHVEVEIDLTISYEFESIGTYTVTARNPEGFEPAWTEPIEMYTDVLQSQDAKDLNKAHDVRDRINFVSHSATGCGPVGTIDCDSSEIAAIEQAYVDMAANVPLAPCWTNTSPGDPLTTMWFGNNGVDMGNIQAEYRRIQDIGCMTGAFTDGSRVSCDCDTQYQSAYAYVFASDTSHTVHVCDAFWPAPTIGEDSKMGVMVHELSHFVDIAETDDNVYGCSGAKALAISDASKARNNADSFEYYIERPCGSPDVCVDGQTCTGDACNNDGTCTNGACVFTHKSDGTSCNDGDSDTDFDTCTGGACAGVPACDSQAAGGYYDGTFTLQTGVTAFSLCCALCIGDCVHVSYDATTNSCRLYDTTSLTIDDVDWKSDWGLGCHDVEESWISDAYCDHDTAPVYNTEACRYDGGDCCPETCVGSGCGNNEYLCRQPAYVSWLEIGTGLCRHGSDENTVISDSGVKTLEQCRRDCLDVQACTAISHSATACTLFSGGPYTYATGCATCTCYVIETGEEPVTEPGYYGGSFNRVYVASFLECVAQCVPPSCIHVSYKSYTTECRLHFTKSGKYDSNWWERDYDDTLCPSMLGYYNGPYTELTDVVSYEDCCTECLSQPAICTQLSYRSYSDLCRLHSSATGFVNNGWWQRDVDNSPCPSDTGYYVGSFFKIYVDSFHLCCKECRQRPFCKRVSFRLSDTQCRLHTSTTGFMITPVWERDVDSPCQQDAGYIWTGTYDRIDGVPSFTECCELCLASAACIHFSYKNNGFCMKFTSTTGKTGNIFWFSDTSVDDALIISSSEGSEITWDLDSAELNEPVSSGDASSGYNGLSVSGTSELLVPDMLLDLEP